MLPRFIDWFRRWLRPAPEINASTDAATRDPSSMAELVRLLGRQPNEPAE